MWVSQKDKREFGECFSLTYSGKSASHLSLSLNFFFLLRSILDAFTEVEMVSMVIHNCTCAEEAKNRR